MIKKAIHIIQRAILLVLACQILNLSTDSIDFQPIHTSNIYEFNDLNTITEYFAEVVFGNTNAFPESLHKEQKQSQLQKHGNIKLISPVAVTAIVPGYHILPALVFPFSEADTYLFTREIIPPPPKKAALFIS